MVSLRFGARLAPLVVFLGCTADTFTASDGGPDAATGDSGGADVTTSSDGSSSDGSGVDAISGDSGPDLSCANPPSGTILCDDFDAVDAGSPAQKWTGELKYNGKNAFDPSTFHSAPQSFRASTILGDGSASFADAALLIQAPSAVLGANSVLTARAFMRVHATDSNANVRLMRVSYEPTSGTLVWAAIVVGNDKLQLVVQADGTSIGSTDDLVGLTLDVWALLQIDMTLGPAPKINVLLDGLLMKSITPALAAPSNSPLPAVELGILDGTTGYATVVNFDNFLFRIH